MKKNRVKRGLGADDVTKHLLIDMSYFFHRFKLFANSLLFFSNSAFMLKRSPRDVGGDIFDFHHPGKENFARFP